MAGEAQQIVFKEQPGMWSTFDSVIRDLLTHDIPASVVLLIVVCILGPIGFRYWINSRGDK